MSERIKINLNGAAETMLQSFYARAKYSKSKKHKFYDAKAVKLRRKFWYLKRYKMQIGEKIDTA